MYQVVVKGPNPSTLDFPSYEEAADYVSVIFDTMDADEAAETSVKIRSVLPGDAIVEGNPGALSQSDEYPYKVTLNNGEARYFHNLLAASDYAAQLQDEMDDADLRESRLEITAGPEAAITDGNPGALGPGADPLDVIIEEGENVTVVNHDGESLVSWDENGERHTVLVDEAGSLSHWDSQGLVAHEPGRGIVEGNPGSEPLHEALAEIATDVAYEAEVVAAAADEVDDAEIAAGAEDQAEAMDEAAEALDEAAEIAAEVAADVFIETGSPTVEVADTDSPEGEIVSGEIETEAEAVAAEIVDEIEEVIEDAVDDIPPLPQHWYKRRWARV